VSIQSAADRLGLSERTIWRLIKEGRLDVVHVGRKALVKYPSLKRLVEAE